MKGTLIKFSEAIQAYKDGDTTKAAESLSQALGSNKTLPVVENNIGMLINPSEPMADAMLRIMLIEERK